MHIHLDLQFDNVFIEEVSQGGMKSFEKIPVLFQNGIPSKFAMIWTHGQN